MNKKIPLIAFSILWVTGFASILYAAYLSTTPNFEQMMLHIDMALISMLLGLYLAYLYFENPRDVTNRSGENQ